MNHHIPIAPDLLHDLLIFLGKLDTHPSVRHEARDYAHKLGEAAAIGGEHTHKLELLGCELIEAVNGATGRQIETVLTDSTVTAARAALSEVVPALGKVIEMPRPVPRVVEGGREPVPPISAILVVAGEPYGDALDLWAVPAVGHAWMFEQRLPGERLPRARRVRVLDVVWVNAWTVEIHTARLEETVDEALARVEGQP